MTANPPTLARSQSRLALAFAAALGAGAVLGFAPFAWFPLPILLIAVLLRLWQRAATRARAAAIGFAFGLGFFLAGVSWVYVSLQEFGGMPVPLAALATLLFCAYLAAFPAAVGYAFAAAPLGAGLRLAVFFPAAWALAEWVRGWLFTGFPWLELGYSQIAASPLAGYAPVLGIHGVTLAAAASAGLIVDTILRLTQLSRRGARLRAALLQPSLLILAALWLGGFALQHVRWTHPAGEPVSVSLLQGNIAQSVKWRPEQIKATLETYRELVHSSTSRLIILPETSLPLFADDVPKSYFADFAAHARSNGGDILVGVPERGAGRTYFNTVMSLGTAPTQYYRKSHLVPFGEYIPLRPVLGLIVNVLSIPMQDFSRGTLEPSPLDVAGLHVAVNICYEDAFGAEIIRQLPRANVLVNASNVAWFGHSIAPEQHLQISQARALETGRYMLRATNTGATAVVNPQGHVVALAPEFTRTDLTYHVEPYAGETPYVRFGNGPVLGLCVLLIAGVFGRRLLARRRGRHT